MRNKLREFIVKGKISDVFTLLKKYYEHLNLSDELDQLILLQGAFNRNEMSNNQGLIDIDTYNRSLQKTTRSLLDILKDIPEDATLGDGASKPTPSTTETKEFFYISYAWGGDSEAIVNKIDESLQTKGIKIIRDKRDLPYGGSISEFMKEIGKGKGIIVVISQKYLKSENCMFELSEIAKAGSFRSRIIPVILEDSNIYSPLGRISYIKYWDERIKELDSALKSIDVGVNLQELQKELNDFHVYRSLFDRLSADLKDMNALTPEIHRNEDFSSIYERLQQLR